ncbi:MAG TPA: dihydropteroate synthase [Clostridiales bacterium]|nr:dihydropteroate synthase [Clostridiales bacterium]
MNKNLFSDNSLVFFDGAMGTMLQEKGWNSSQPPEVCNIVSPELVESVHQAYVKAGADIITANTFGANPFKMGPLGYSAEEVVRKGVAIARRAAAGRLVALDIGPLGQLMAPMGALSFNDAYENFAVQVKAGTEAGADLILIETMSDLYEAKAAVLAAKELSSLPVICTLAFQKNGRTLMGNDPLTVVTVLEALGADAIGVNCSLGPEELLPVVGKLTEHAHVPVLVQANAGLPQLIDGRVVYPLNPLSFAESAEKMVLMGVKMLGGCCGTNPEYIKALRNRLGNYQWKQPQNQRITAVASSRKTLSLEKGLHIIGQRINPAGRQDLIQALSSNEFDVLYEEALLQEQAGADILDINVYTGLTDEAETMEKAVEYIQSLTHTPLQLDSADYRALEAGARVVNGKPILNSVNGCRQAMEQIFPIARKYGACVIGMTMDEDGIPENAERRLAIAEKILDTALSYGLHKEDIIIDTIVQSAARLPGNAMETLKAVSLVKRELGLKTVLGISNISYGMKNRPSLNAAFLAMALGAGLDLVIADPASQQIAELIKTVDLLTGAAE